MSSSGYIAARLKFKGKTAVATIAVSFAVMIIAVAISSGFRDEIRKGISAMIGDIQITPETMDYVSGLSPLDSSQPWVDQVRGMAGVKSVKPAVFRAGMVKSGETLHGVLFKGSEEWKDTASLSICIPSRLADILKVGKGDKLPAWFFGEKLKVRSFNIDSTYKAIIEDDGNLVVKASMEDIQRLSAWEEGEVSMFEIEVEDEWRQSPEKIQELADRIGTLLYDEPVLVTTSAERYPQLFGWLDIIDFNVRVILILLTLVAGFNMISGLLIMLLRSISTIGMLKALGMTDRSIAAAFLKASSILVFKGMVAGNVFALGFCLIQHYTHIITLDPENYFLGFVPVHADIPMILLADLAAYAVIMIMLTLPLIFVSKVDPAKTIKTR